MTKITKQEKDKMVEIVNGRIEALGLAGEGEYQVLMSAYRLNKLLSLNAPDAIIEKEKEILAARVTKTGTTEARMAELQAMFPRFHGFLNEEKGGIQAVTREIAERVLGEILKNPLPLARGVMPSMAPSKPGLQLLKGGKK